MGVTRWERLPDVPTLKELGYEVVEGSMRGMAAPAGVPASITARLALSIRRTVENPEFRAQAGQQNLPLRYLEPGAFLEELRALDARCRELWARHPWID